MATAGPSFAELLRHYRMELGLTQEELAARASLSVQAIGALERGERTAPRLPTVRRLQAALGLTARQSAALEDAAHHRHGPRKAALPPVPGAPESSAAFVGREHDEQVLTYLLRQEAVRLLTLTGPGGVGKTRLAVEVAMSVAAAFADGVVFVDLAPLRDPGRVVDAIAHHLGIQVTGTAPPLQRITAALREKRVLLLLDNFEHVMDARTQILELSVACRWLALLVTSRGALRVRGEQEYAVAPLALPPPGVVAPENLADYAAVALFVERARMLKPDLTLTATTAPIVAEICRRLDGLPLAIELAAAMVQQLPPRVMLERLGGLPDVPVQPLPPSARSALNVLSGGSWNLPDRQQTMRGTIAWSYALLGPGEQVLFRRLAVFAGGWTLEAAEAVCAADEAEAAQVLDLLAQLLNTSMVLSGDAARGERRYRLLETVREYAAERLQVNGEEVSWRERHLDWCLWLAEQAEPALRGPEQARWLARLDGEHNNLRVALDWALESRHTVKGLRVSGALWRFWWVHGYLSEGRRYLEEFLARDGHDSREVETEPRTTTAARSGRRSSPVSPGAPAAVRHVRTKALAGAGVLAYWQGDGARATVLLEDCVALCRAVGDTQHLATALNTLAAIAKDRGELDSAAALCEESLTLRRELGDTQDLCISLTLLAVIVRAQGHHGRARVLCEEALALARALGYAWGMAAALIVLVWLLLEEEAFERVAALCHECLTLSRAMLRSPSTAVALEGLALLASARGNPWRAAEFLGAAAALRESLDTPMPPLEQAFYAPMVAATRGSLGDDAFALASAAGRASSLEQIVDEILVGKEERNGSGGSRGGGGG